MCALRRAAAAGREHRDERARATGRVPSAVAEHAGAGGAGAAAPHKERQGLASRHKHDTGGALHKDVV